MFSSVLDSHIDKPCVSSDLLEGGGVNRPTTLANSPSTTEARMRDRATQIREVMSSRGCPGILFLTRFAKNLLNSFATVIGHLSQLHPIIFFPFLDNLFFIVNNTLCSLLQIFKILNFMTHVISFSRLKYLSVYFLVFRIEPLKIAILSCFF